jgi:nitrogen fixation protein FixH
MTRQQELRGWHVGAMMAAFFAVVIGVNATFITLATQTFPGEIVKKSYLQGLHYNQTIATRSRQTELHWRAQATFAGAGSKAFVRVRMLDREGRPLDGLTLTGALKRTVTDTQDVNLAFVRAGEGLYAAALPANFGRGRWVLSAQAAREGAQFDMEANLTWR